jgi:membrane protease subunit HflK
VADAPRAAQRSLAVSTAYSQAPDVTTRRISLETLEQVLRDMNKVVIDKSASGSGVVPYLPLPELERRARERAPDGAAESNGDAQ